MKRKLTLFISSFLIISAFSLPFLLFAQTGGPPQGPPCPPGQICSPFKGTNINNLTDFINFVLENIVLPIGSIIAVFFLIYAGFLFVTAGGNEDKLATAKKTFLWTIVGIAILLGAVVISNGIKNTICEIAPNIPGLGCP